MSGRFRTSEGVEGDLTFQLVPKNEHAMVFRVGAQRMSDIQMIRKQETYTATGAR